MSKLRKSAKGADCQIRIPGVCDFNPETTVLCHLNGAGMGLKQSDIHASFGCSNCHDTVDFRKENKDFNRLEIESMHLHGMFRTQKIWIALGLIKIN